MTTKKERYVMLRYWLLKSQAWNSLPGGARALYIEMAQRYNGSNNGRIPYSVREAAQSLDISHHTGGHWLRILQDRGFIVCTKRGAFSLKTTKEASEWLLTEYASDHPPAHATKDFMRWQPPEGVDTDTLNRQPSHHRKSKTRRPQPYRTEAPAVPYGGPSRTVEAKNAENGGPSRTVNAQNDALTEAPALHLQLPGIGREPGVCDLPSFLAGEPAEKKPWSTPTVEEIPWDILPTELRMLVLGLPDPEGCYGRAECGQVEKAPREADQAPAPAAARTNGAPPDTNACRDASLHAPAADPAPEPELPDPAATEPQSPQASNGSAVRQAGETEAETEGVPPPTTPQEPQAISKGLSDLRRRELAEQYEDRRYWCSPADIAAGVLDIEMRALLCREISAEQVEIELGRIRATR